jgi:hypothetical protein
MEKTKESSVQTVLFNTLVHVGALFSYQYLELIWPLYISMGILGILILIQTFSAAVLFSLAKTEKEQPLLDYKRGTDYNLATLILCVAYFAVIYQLYIVGFTIFAIVAATHVTITFISNMMRFFIE